MRGTTWLDTLQCGPLPFLSMILQLTYLTLFYHLYTSHIFKDFFHYSAEGKASLFTDLSLNHCFNVVCICDWC